MDCGIFMQHFLNLFEGGYFCGTVVNRHMAIIKYPKFVPYFVLPVLLPGATINMDGLEHGTYNIQ